MSLHNGKAVWTPSELVAYNPGVIPWIVEPLVRPGSVMVVFGPREAGKTQFLLTLVKALHERALFLGRFPTRPVRVALIEVDMPFLETQERMQRASSSYTFDNAQFRVATLPDFDVLRLTKLVTWVNELGMFEPEIVMFDSLRKIHREKETDTAVPSAVYAKCKELFPKAALIFAHHVTKPPSKLLQKQHNYDPTEDDHVYRGTTAWLDDADAAVYLRRDDADKRSLRVTRCRFSRDSIKREVIGLSLATGGMFLEPCALAPAQWMLHWKMQHPAAARSEAIEAAKQEFPEASTASYYRWADAAGYEKQWERGEK